MAGHDHHPSSATVVVPYIISSDFGTRMKILGARLKNECRLLKFESKLRKKLSKNKLIEFVSQVVAARYLAMIY